MSKRIIKTMSIALLALATLTACDPPIPQSILVAQAEATVQCESGNVTISSEDSYADLGLSWQQSLSAACEQMTLEVLEPNSPADLQISSAIEPSCEAFAQVPVAIDATAVAFYLDEATLLELSPSSIDGIFSGEISSWNDPAILQDNPEFPGVDLPINVITQAPAAVIAAMENWVANRTGAVTKFELMQPTEGLFFLDQAFGLANGDIALLPFSAVQSSGSSYANFIADPEDELGAVTPDLLSVYAAKTQTTFEVQDSRVILTMDFEKEPQPQPGQNEADRPYQAVYPIYLSLCGEDNSLKRTMARYLLRLDAQGLIATSTVLGILEDVRIESAVVVSEGLVLPEVDLEPQP